MVAKRTSTCSMNFSAIRIASRYCPLLTCRNMSEMHAALDSSNADRTLKVVTRQYADNNFTRSRSD